MGAKKKSNYNWMRLRAREILSFGSLWKSQHFSREKIDAYHDEQLIKLIRYAGTKVPYYRNLFQDIGLDLKSFRGREDMHLIPLLDKETLRTKNSELLSEDAYKITYDIDKTSGSTGTPLEIAIDENCRAYKNSAVIRAMVWAGYYPIRKRFMIRGLSESKDKDWGYDKKQNLLYLNSSRLTKDNCLAVARELQKFNPKYFEGYARSFIDFYSVINEHGINIPKPVGMYCYGETITPSVRKYIEENYSTYLYDHYGNRENTAIIDQMPDHKQHLIEDFFYPEIIDESGAISGSDYGELVSTSYHNYVMPLIRYKTRDYVHLQSGEQKGKYSFRVVDAIEGRMDDFLLLPDGRKIYFAEGALGYAKGVVTGQYIQDQPDHLTVKLIVDSSFNDSYLPEIEKGLIKRIGDSLRFSFEIVSELEKKGSGKVPFIINRITK